MNLSEKAYKEKKQEADGIKADADAKIQEAASALIAAATMKSTEARENAD